MKTITRFLTPLLAIVVLVSMAFSQGSSTLPYPGRYGLSAWAVNNQRVASQYNYYIPSLSGSGLGSYTFPPSVIYQAISKGSVGQINPFNTNAPVKIIDINSTLTETVVFNSLSCTTGGGIASVCTLSLANSNAHTSYVLRSGTCGLREALNDLGANGGEVIIDQRFYDDGCTQATITGINALVATASTSGVGPIYPNQYVHDISNGQDLWYKVGATSVTLQSAPTAPTLTGTTGGTLTASSTYYVAAAYVDLLGQVTAGSTSNNTVATSTTYTAISAASPAAQTGAVGWIPYITAAGGSDTTEIMVPVTSSVCTLTTLETVIPACAIGSAAFIGANPSSTAFMVATNATASDGFGTAAARTAFGFVPTATNPNFTSSVGSFPETAVAFTGRTETSGKTYDEAMIYIPAGTFNYLGSKWRICWAGDGTGNTVPVPKFLLQTANQLEQSPNTIATYLFTAITAASTSFRSCSLMTIAATGTSGTAYVTGEAFSQLAAGGGTPQTWLDENTAAVTVGNLTQGIWLTLQSVPTVSTGITTFTVRQFSIEAVP